MAGLAEAIRQLGFAAFLVGYGIYLASILWQPLEHAIRRSASPRPAVIGFYARAVGTVGLVAGVLAGILTDPGSWPLALLIFVIFGAPAIALLVWRPVRSNNVGLGIGSLSERTRAPTDEPPSVHSGEPKQGDDWK